MPAAPSMPPPSVPMLFAPALRRAPSTTEIGLAASSTTALKQITAAEITQHLRSHRKRDERNLQG